MAAAARRARRLFGPMGNAVQQDVPAAMDTEEKAKDAFGEADFGASVAYPKAGKHLTKTKRDGGKEGKSEQVKGVGERDSAQDRGKEPLLCAQK